MFLLKGALILIALVTVWYRVANAENEETPAFSLVSKLANNVEIRNYSPSKWACTSSSAKMMQDYTMFWNLFSFIQGKNDQNQKVNKI